MSRLLLASNNNSLYHVSMLLDRLFSQWTSCNNCLIEDDLVLLYLHEDSLLAILIDALRLSLESHLVSHFIWHVIDEESQLLIQDVIFHWMIDEGILWDVSVVSHLNDDFVKSFNLKVSLFEMLKQLN